MIAILIENLIILIGVIYLYYEINKNIGEINSNFEYLKRRIEDLDSRLKYLEQYRKYDNLEKYVQDLNARINLIKLSNKLKEGGE